MRKVKEESKVEASERRRRRRKEEKERKREKRNETVTVKEDVRVWFLWKAFEIFCQEGDVESCGDVSWEDLWTILRTCLIVSLIRARVPLLIDVPVSPSSVVTELCDVSPCGSDWGLWNRSPFLLLKKRAHRVTGTQEEMWYESSPVKAPPLSRRR